MNEIRAQIINTYASWTALSALRSGCPVKSRVQVYGLFETVPFDRLFEPFDKPINAAEFASWHRNAVWVYVNVSRCSASDGPQN